MIIDLLLCFFIISTYTISGTICSLIILIFPLLGVISFKNRNKWGDSVAMIVLIILSIIFILSGLNELSKDNTTNTIQGFLLILLALSTMRRVRTVRDPTYKNWYNSLNEDFSEIKENISDEEVLATCPSCSTLLAVIPSKLSIEDKCPNCNAKLVN
jgi:Na+/proline symporter